MNKKITFLTIALSISINVLYSQVKNQYINVFTELQYLIDNESQYRFKRAVFITENVFLDNTVKYSDFCKVINNYKSLVEESKNANILKYNYKDKINMEYHAAIFAIMTDTINIKFDTLSLTHTPFSYDFDDIWGNVNWEQMFVNKLLATHKGNCHSLPFFYKILADELGVEAHLSLAPNHMYIKTKSEKYGWYNTELSSAMFPVDAWIMASGYIHLNAIQNSLYMSALDDKQSIAICMTDLAEGYARKTNFTDPDFIIMCCDTALKYLPNYVNANLLKIKTLKHQLVTELNKTNQETQKSDKLFAEMELLSTNLYLLGYRQMPKKMYLNWLVSLKQECEKYTNKRL